MRGRGWGLRSGWVALLAMGMVAVTACSSVPDEARAGGQGGLTLATWNLEHLAAKDGLGCRARSEADYAALRRHAAELDADVIALEEVENAAAAARVFPPDQYVIVMSTRPDSGRDYYCERDASSGPKLRHQAVGFAIRKGIDFTRNADLSALGLGNPDLRWGVDITLGGAKPLRLLAVHLKSGCSAGDERDACPVIFDQAPVLANWIKAREAENMPFAILGDFNRRLALPGDRVWAELTAAAPLLDAAEGRSAHCLERYPDFIDHIVLDDQAAARRVRGSFNEYTYGVPEEQHPSDHCPLTLRLN